MKYDVIVIGGGPAGLSAAIVCARTGIPTLLCEARKSFPLDKPCGEGLMPTCVRDLERLGISRAAVLASGAPFAGVRYVSEHGCVAQADFAEGAGVALRRTKLSELMVARARNLPCLTVRSGAAARIRRRERGFDVLVDNDVLTPRLVIGADGLSSRIRVQAGIDDRLGRPFRWGVRRHFRIAARTEYVEVHWRRGVEAYITPLGAEGVNVAFLWDKDRFREHGGALGVFNALLESFPHLARRLQGATPCSAPRASGPMHRRVRQPACDGLLLIGDAAGYVDALTGEGVGLALREALLLERLVVPLLPRGTASVFGLEAMKPYVRAARLACRPNHQFTRLLLRLSEQPALMERTIAAMATEPALFRHFLTANLGGVSPFRMPPAAAARVLLRLFESPRLPDATPPPSAFR